MILIFTTGKTAHRIEAIAMNKIEPYIKHIEGICGDGGKFYKITDEG